MSAYVRLPCFSLMSGCPPLGDGYWCLVKFSSPAVCWTKDWCSLDVRSLQGKLLKFQKPTKCSWKANLCMTQWGSWRPNLGLRRLELRMPSSALVWKWAYLGRVQVWKFDLCRVVTWDRMLSPSHSSAGYRIMRLCRVPLTISNECISQVFN